MNGNAAPSLDLWLKEAKADASAKKCGMYLFHNGTVRATARDIVRNGRNGAPEVRGMMFDYDEPKLDEAVRNTLGMPGIFHVRVWLNRGELRVGDDIMLVLVGGDIRPHVTDALSFLVGEIKEHCVTEKEIY